MRLLEVLIMYFYVTTQRFMQVSVDLFFKSDRGAILQLLDRACHYLLSVTFYETQRSIDYQCIILDPSWAANIYAPKKTESELENET